MNWAAWILIGSFIITLPIWLYKYGEIRGRYDWGYILTQTLGFFLLLCALEVITISF